MFFFSQTQDIEFQGSKAEPAVLKCHNISWFFILYLVTFVIADMLISLVLAAYAPRSSGTIN